MQPRDPWIPRLALARLTVDVAPKAAAPCNGANVPGIDSAHRDGQRRAQAFSKIEELASPHESPLPRARACARSRSSSGSSARSLRAESTLNSASGDSRLDAIPVRSRRILGAPVHRAVDRADERLLPGIPIAAEHDAGTRSPDRELEDASIKAAQA